MIEELDIEERERERGLLEQLRRFVGTTVTIFTTSGGLSGSGFTGVLQDVDRRAVRLITCIGPAPCNPLRIGFGGIQDGCFGFARNVGSVTVIPVDRIAAFVHNAI